MLSRLQVLKSCLQNQKYSSSIEQIILQASKKHELLNQYPEFEEELNQAESLGIKPGHLGWVVKQLKRREPILEIVNTIKEFTRFQNRLDKENRDLYGYETLADLRQAIETSAPARSKKQLQRGDHEVIWENDEVMIVHPYSMEASCYFGQGTRWCVSATVSQNYFEDYASRNIFLYFILTKHPKPESDLSKIAYALAKEDGRVSEQIFDAKDQEISKDQVAEYLNSDNFETLHLYKQIEKAIYDHVKLKDNTKFKEYLENLTLEQYRQIHDEDRRLAIRQMLASRSASPEILGDILDNFGNKDTLITLLHNNNLTSDLLSKMYKKLVDDRSVEDPDPFILEGIAKHHNSSPALLEKVFEKVINLDSGRTPIRTLLKNPNTPAEILVRIFELDPISRPKSRRDQLGWMVGALNHPNFPKEKVEEYLLSTDLMVLTALAKSEQTPPKIFRNLFSRLKFKQNESEILAAFAYNPSTPVEILNTLLNSKDENLTKLVLMNSSLPPETIRRFYQTLKDLDSNLATTFASAIAYNSSAPPDVLMELAKHFEHKVLMGVAVNENTPEEVLKYLIANPGYSHMNYYQVRDTAKAYLKRRGLLNDD